MNIEGRTNPEQNEELFELDELCEENICTCSLPEPTPDISYQDDKMFYFSTCGSRTAMEEYVISEDIQVDYVINPGFMLIGMYDGHGGSTVAFHLKNNLLHNIVRLPGFLEAPQGAILQAIAQIEKQILDLVEEEDSGSAILVMFSDYRGTLVVNVGDVMCYGIKKYSKNRRVLLQRSQLNLEHTLQVEEERKQVRRKGGLIFQRGGRYRVGGELNLSRSIGDRRYKPSVSAIPSVQFYPSSQKQNKFESLVVMTDGCVEAFKQMSLNAWDLSQFSGFIKKYKKFKDNATILVVNAGY